MDGWMDGRMDGWVDNGEHISGHLAWTSPSLSPFLAVHLLEGPDGDALAPPWEELRLKRVHPTACVETSWSLLQATTLNPSS